MVSLYIIALLYEPQDTDAEIRLDQMPNKSRIITVLQLSHTSVGSVSCWAA